MTAQPSFTSCVLRIAGVPCGAWLAAANPALFARVRELDRRRADYEAHGRQLAAALGQELLADPGLPRADRLLAIALRRSLHNGRPIEAAACEPAVRLAAALGRDAPGWRERLEAAANASRVITALERDVERDVVDEEARQAALAWALVRDVPIVRVLVSHRDPSFLPELEARVSRGLAWGCKSARRSGAYVWKVLTRAATKSNPRDWHGHVALLPVRDGASPMPVGVGPRFAAQWIENVHRQRRELVQGLATARGCVRIALTPLHWRTDTHLRAWIVDQEDPTAVKEVEMRRIPLLDAIHDALAGGSVRWDALVAAPEVVDAEERALLPGIAEHLLRLGVLELSSSPRERFVAPPAADGGCEAVDALVMGHAPRVDPGAPALDERRKEVGFLDVYRRAEGSLPVAVAGRLERCFAEVQRLYALIEADQRGTSAPRPSDTPAVPLLEAIEARVLAPLRSGSTVAPASTRHWPMAREPGSGYGRLLAWLADEGERAGVIDIDAARLDALGAPPPCFDWPVDCVVRLPHATAAYDAVLDEAFPAGTLDARFVSALQRLEGAVPHVDGYREFLQELEAATGATILELLIPPLSMGAANAIRRPLLARAWTGDPDVQLYFDDARAATLRYVPLGALTLRRTDGQSVVEAAGRRMWPVYHATRMPLPPWNVLADALLTAAPATTRWSPRRLHFSLDAFDERTSMPRITVGGTLVVSCAQWRLPGGEPWDRRASLRSKIQALERLRARLGLPRWVFASAGPRRKPRACDLESTLGLRAVELATDDAARVGGDVILAEMLPTPEELLVVDGAGASPITGLDRSVASVMLRLPLHEPPRAMARRIAQRVSGR